MPIFRPSTVTTFSSDQGPFSNRAHRQMFFHKGRLHMIWCDGTYSVHQSSANGSTWTSQNQFVGCNRGYKESLWYTPSSGGVYRSCEMGEYPLFYAYANGTNTGGYWRRIQPNANGTITLGNETVPGTLLGSTYRSYFVTCVDSSGYPWVGYGAYDNTRYEPAVGRATNTTGTTWGTHTMINAGLTGGMGTMQLVPYSNNKMGCFYDGNTSYLYYSEYNGSSWDVSSTAITSASVGFWSVCTYNDYVYALHVENDTSNRKILIKSHQVGSGWSSASTVVPTVDTDSVCIGIDYFKPNDPRLFVVYEVGDRYIYFKTKTLTESAWSSEILLHDEGSDVNLRDLSIGHDMQRGRLAIGFVTGLGSPYNLKVGIFEYRKKGVIR